MTNLKLCLITTILALPFSANAASLSCKIDFNLASNSGLVGVDQTILISNIPVQGNDLDLSKCVEAPILQSKSISICAQEHPTAFGIVQVGAYQTKSEDISSGSLAMLAINKNNRNELVLMNKASSAIEASVINTLSKNEIQIPTEMQFDTLMVDDAVTEGVKKGLLKNGQLITFGISDCQKQQK